MTIAENYSRIDYQGCDVCLEYARHEIAHFVVLFGRIPKTKADTQDMGEVLDNMTCGRAQRHELRVIRLEADDGSCELRDVLELVWSSMCDVAEERRKGQKVTVPTIESGLIQMRAMYLSPRLIRTYRAALTYFANQTAPG